MFKRAQKRTETLKDRCLIGMWRYAFTKKLRKRINKAATLRMCLKIDRDSQEKLVDNYCGTHPLDEDCPFHVNAIEPNKCGICLAPSNDTLWHQAMKQGKSFISPSYEKRNHMVVGCYLLIFCELGYANYNRVLRWRKRSGKVS